MTHLRFKPFAAAAAMLAALLLAACASSGTPQDGRYQTHGGGRDNFRAEAPAMPEAVLPSPYA
jgi:major membrane immunogen (membrane-anchored lipoprotein)